MILIAYLSIQALFQIIYVIPLLLVFITFLLILVGLTLLFQQM